jgi:hypothetical protein
MDFRLGRVRRFHRVADLLIIALGRIGAHHLLRALRIALAPLGFLLPLYRPPLIIC